MQTFNAFYRSKAKPRSATTTLPKIDCQESTVDLSLLDVMSVDDFLLHMKNKTDNNWKELWKESCIITEQLKACRDLLSIGSNLLTHNSSRSILNNLLDIARVLVNAERVLIMEIDTTGRELIITHALDEKLLGLRCPVNVGIEGDVILHRTTANVSDVNLDSRHNAVIEGKLGIRLRAMLCAPVLCDGVAVGVLVATTKLSPGLFNGKHRQPSELSNLSFSSHDAQLLSYVAANVGLALKHTSFVQSIGLSSPTDVARLENDFNFQKLVDLLHIYNKIDAERVSVFVYSPSNKNLVCVVSKDIKGLVIPHDKGLVGLAFTAMRVINVADARFDDRHYKDVDQNVGYTTRSVLCAPIVSVEGVPIGVVQVINKKSGSSFTTTDEQQILSICETMVSLLKERANGTDVSSSKGTLRADIPDDRIDNLEESQLQSTKFVDIDFANGLSRLPLSQSVSQLAANAELLVLTSKKFDFFRVYMVYNDSLVRVSTAESMSTNQLEHESMIEGTECLDFDDTIAFGSLSWPLQNALQFSNVVEFNKNSDALGTPLLANEPLMHALVIPIGPVALSFTAGKCLLICGHRDKSVDTNQSEACRPYLELLRDVFSSSLLSLSQRSSFEDNCRQLRRQYHLLNNTLGALNDFVIILDSDGKLVGCNKPVEELLGLQQLSAEVIYQAEMHQRKSRSVSGRSSPTPAVDPKTGHVKEGMHFSEWLTNGNSPELCRDIFNALKNGESRSLEAARLTSNKYPEGISVDYQVTAISPQNTRSHNIRSERLTRSASKRAMETAMPEIPENSSPLVNVVVVTIHINKRPGLELDEAVPSVGSAGDSLPSMDLIKSATGGVDSAASILAAVRNNYVLDEESELQIKQLTNSLVQASRRMSIQQSSFSANAINIALQAEVVMLVNPSISLPENMFEWEFDVLQIKDSLVLCNIIGKYFESLFDLDRLNVDSTTLARYIAEAGRHYHDRPFHNLQHATGVTHFCSMLIRTTGAPQNLTELQLFSVLLSAVVHDVDHPGNTNLFEINSGSELAMRYNDQSVLENHHCSTAFRIMRKPHMQVLANMDKKVAADIRKTMITCIMATDMAVHFELIEETKKRANVGWNFDEAKDQALLGKMLLHAADLSNPVRPFHMTREWAQRISIEFNDQVQREQALGMPVLGFMMTPDEKAFCKNEMGFASFVVAPMWRAFSLSYPDLEFLVQQLESNLTVWKSHLETIQAEENKREGSS